MDDELKNAPSVLIDDDHPLGMFSINYRLVDSTAFATTADGEYHVNNGGEKKKPI